MKQALVMGWHVPRKVLMTLIKLLTSGVHSRPLPHELEPRRLHTEPTPVDGAVLVLGGWPPLGRHSEMLTDSAAMTKMVMFVNLEFRMKMQ